MEYGLHNISEAEYNNIPAIRSSSLKELKRSALHCRYAETHFDEHKTPALKLGEWLHCKLLLPSEFDKRYHCLAEKIDKRTTVGKERFAELADQYGADNLINDNDQETITNVIASAKMNPAIVNLLKSVKGVETSLYWEENQIGMKARLDGWNHQLNAIIDVKTTEDASPEGFARSIAKYNYHLQAAHYIAGAYNLKIFGEDINKYSIKFYFICLEKKPPYATAVYMLSPDAIVLGFEQRDALIDKYKECLISKHWGTYSEKIELISLPSYAFRSAENE